MLLELHRLQSGVARFVPSWPLVVWIMVAALVLGLGSGMNAVKFIQVFNLGWGRAIGEFALILMPSFVLAAVLTRKNIGKASRLAVLASPVAGAGMICPDTAYAALSPIAGRQRLSVAFGSYAGFKLLFPAGPLIVATGLGVNDVSLMIYGLILLLPVWAIGVLWASYVGGSVSSDKPGAHSTANGNQLLRALFPFALMLMLLVTGYWFDFSSQPVLDFMVNPKGALMVAAAWAVISLPAHQRRECFEEAVQRTGSLLFVIGAASAFGGVLIYSLPVAAFIPMQDGLQGIVGLFLLTAAFKLVQGSSMATFAAVTPVAAPMVAAINLPLSAAVFAICLGSFVAILPNDSFYWLVRKDALPVGQESKNITLLAGGALLQALGGLAILLLLVSLGIIQ